MFIVQWVSQVKILNQKRIGPSFSTEGKQGTFRSFQVTPVYLGELMMWGNFTVNKVIIDQLILNILHKETLFFLLVLRILHSRCIPKPKARAQQALVFTKLCLYILFSFFSGNYGRCLLNKPQTNALDWFKSASQYPGQHFDENRLP